MFRKIIFPTILSCLFALPSFSQITVGSTAAPITGSAIDIESTNQGILFPRVKLTATGTWGLLGTGTTGMVVYNTNASISGSGAQGVGLYCWNNTMSQWSYLQSGLINYWSLIGNSGTTAGTNFIGTTDANDFVTKTSGSERMRITSAGNVGIGSSSPAQSLEIGTTTGTVRIDGLKSGNTYNSSSTAATSTLVYSNNTTGDLYSLPTVNNATLVTNSTGVPSWTANTITAWQLLGNSGTTQPGVPATYGTSTFASGENFVGTIDAKDLVMGSSNTERMRIISTGYVGIGTSTPNRALVVQGNHTNNIITIENTNVAGYSSIDMYDNTGNLASTFGYGNPSSAPFTARGYFNQYQHDFVWMNTVNSVNNPVLFISGQSATPGWIGVQTVTPQQVFEVAPTTGTVRVDGLKSGNSFNSSSTASTSTILYSNNSTGDIYSLPTVNNATLVTNSTGMPSWSTIASGSITHLAGTTGTPTYTAGTGAGTSPTITITGTDLAGKITLKVGTGIPAANSAIITLNFNTAYSTAPYVVYSPGNANAAQLTTNKPFINSTSTANFVLESGPTSLVSGNAYVWYYMVAQ